MDDHRKPPTSRRNPAFVNAASRWDDTTLFQAERHMMDMLASEGWQTVSSMLHQASTAKRDYLERVDPLGKADYAQQLGVLRGQRAAVEAAEAVLWVAARRRAEQVEQAESLPDVPGWAMSRRAARAARLESRIRAADAARKG